MCNLTRSAKKQSVGLSTGVRERKKKVLLSTDQNQHARTCTHGANPFFIFYFFFLLKRKVHCVKGALDSVCGYIRLSNASHCCGEVQASGAATCGTGLDGTTSYKVCRSVRRQGPLSFSICSCYSRQAGERSSTPFKHSQAGQKQARRW